MHDENTFISILVEDPPSFQFDVAAIPQGPGGNTPNGMWNFGLLSISKESQSKEAAWEFVKHLASAEEEARYFEQVSFSPCRTDLADVMYKDNPYMAKVQTDILPGSKGWQLHPQLNAMLGESQPHFDALYLGQQTAEETLGNVCAVIEGSL
jgi:ABC-type glycerol-3-phosphate transport system substrate-binding protein